MMRLQCQATQRLAGMLPRLRPHGSVGTRRNSNGHTTSRIGDKLHLTWPINWSWSRAIVTSVRIQDSQPAMPLASNTAQCVTYHAEFVNAADDANAVARNCRTAGRSDLP